MSGAAKAVFLSYASQDAEAARRICDALRAAGVEVWFDQSELTGGDAWDQKIRGQIKTCALFVPIISANSNARREGYFRREWKLAVDRTHDMDEGLPFLVPVVIDGTTDAGAFVPEKFREVQWTRIASADSSRAFCERVKRLLSGEIVAAASPASPTPPARPPPGRRFSPAWLFVLIPLAILLLAGGGVALKRFKDGAANRPSQPGPSAPLSEARKLVAQARALFEDGDDLNRESFFLAEELLKRAVALDSTDGEVWAAQAQLSHELLFRSYDVSNARREAFRTQAERAMKLAPQSVEAQAAYVGYLTSLPSAASNQEAVDLGRRIVGRGATNRRLWRNLGWALGTLNRVDEAMAAYDHANALPGGDPRALCDKAAQCMWAGNYEAAEAAIAASFALKPMGRAQVMDVLLKLCWQGDLDGAAAAVNRWPAWLLREPRGAFMASQVWLWRREPDKATAVIGALSTDALNDTYFTGPKAALLALAHEMAGRTEAARAEWEMARKVATRTLADNPTPRRVQGLKAVALARLGERTEAESLFRELEQTGGLASDFWSVAAPSALLRIALGQGTEVPVRFDREPRGAVLNSFTAYARAPQAALRLNPVFDPIRHTPEFQRWLETAPAPARTPAAEQTRPPNEKSIAVVAFENLSGDKDNEYFSDGISEELLNVLAKVPGLRVAARTSAFYFKGKNVTAQEIGRTLGVAHLVDGSVQRNGENIRVMARLSRADTGEQLWSDKFSGELKNIFALQDEIAGRIADNLKLKLGAAALGVKREMNPEAHRLYLEGRHFWSRRSEEGFARAERAFTQAVQLEPTFARAHAGLADLWTIQGLHRVTGGASNAPPLLAKADLAARRALELEPELAEVHATFGMLHLIAGRIEDAQRANEKCLALAPNYATARNWHGEVMIVKGRLDLALDDFLAAAALDPLSPIMLIDSAQALLGVRRLSEALAYAERALALNADSIQAMMCRARALLQLGRNDEAVSTVRSIAGKFESDQLALSRAGPVIYVLRQCDRTAEALALAEKILPRIAPDSFVRGTILAVLGRFDEALPLLTKLPAASRSGLFVHEMFDPLRDDPRFPKLIEQLGCTAEYKVARETLARMKREQEAKK
ncbi:MAG: TIR domain-containing protein [Opitutaceae bacterium]|nr:TIR domain-containing protein [Opitutaceae bacterium]